MFSKFFSPNLKRPLLRYNSNLTFEKVLPTMTIPYGLADWKQIRRENGLFVDKTKFIKMIDDGYAHSCLWSPRRTGKTLLCNQMSLIHDKVVDTRRAALFKDTFIDQNPSKCAGQYLVLNLNFSTISLEDVRGSFNRYIYSAINNFSKKYVHAGLLKCPVEVKEGDFFCNILRLSAEVRSCGERLSVIVDETDSFANQLMLQIEPGKGFATSDYYENVKKPRSLLCEFGHALQTASNDGGIARIFMTGVTPLPFNDALSFSLNTMKNLTHLPSFEGALGMKASDAEGFLREILKGHPDIDAQVAQHMETIMFSYNGYRTLPDQRESTLNPQAVWYYLQELRTQGKPPTRLMDPNISQPRRDNMASYLLSAYKASPVPFVSGTFEHPLESHFPAVNLFGPSTTAHSALLSLAYYHGYVTYTDPTSKQKGKLVVSNNEFRKVFIEEVFGNLPQTVLDDLSDVTMSVLSKNVDNSAAHFALNDIYMLYQAGNYSEIVKKIELLKAE